ISASVQPVKARTMEVLPDWTLPRSHTTVAFSRADTAMASASRAPAAGFITAVHNLFHRRARRPRQWGNQSIIPFSRLALVRPNDGASARSMPLQGQIRNASPGQPVGLTPIQLRYRQY